jgi:hypothetical protein
MAGVVLPGSDCRRVIAALRASGMDYMVDHANLIERLLETHGPEKALVALAQAADVYHRSYNRARWRLGIPLPPD